MVEFSALSDLVLQQGFHGFAITGTENPPEITDVTLRGKKVYLTLDQEPRARDIYVTYAWGAQREETGDGRSANQGALRDNWAQESILQPGHTLHRHGLSGRVKVMPSDLSIAQQDNRP